MKFNSQVYSAVSGSIGGITYAHNQGGMYSRARAIPTNPNSSFQQAMRNAMSQLTTAWLATLNTVQRTGWTTFAANVPILDALGQSRTISALAWYIKANSLRLQVGLARIDNAPVVFELATLTLPVHTIAGSANTDSVAFTNTDGWAGEVGGSLLLYFSRAQNATKNFFAGPYRFGGRINGAVVPPTSPQVVTMPFFSGLAGSKIFVKLMCVRADGRPSAVYRQAVTI